MASRLLAFPCHGCGSLNTNWLEEISRAGAVQYFRCSDCGDVWILGTDPETTEAITLRGAHPFTELFEVGLKFLFIDLDIGMLFAEMAKTARNQERREELRAKGVAVCDLVVKLAPTISLTPDDSRKVAERMGQLKAALA